MDDIEHSIMAMDNSELRQFITQVEELLEQTTGPYRETYIHYGAVAKRQLAERNHFA